VTVTRLGSEITAASRPFAVSVTVLPALAELGAAITGGGASICSTTG